MTDSFKIKIPTDSGAALSFDLAVGDVLFLLGANGSGKSSLVTRIFNMHQGHAKRISAHRQTWFESNTLDMTPRARLDVEATARNQDAQNQARYRMWNPAGRASMAIYDLIDADTALERKIAGLVRKGDTSAAVVEAKNPSPIQLINELMRLSNLPIEISVEETQKVIARKNGGPGYSVAELSDGERNAFLIGAEVLTAKPGTLIIIDEPERHLHRSIISPLLKLLFERRQKDCAFIVSTHELMLPVDMPKSSALLVRGCEYQGQEVRTWTADLVPSDVPIDDALKRDLLGARRKMLFVEGTTKSLDVPLYSLLFPDVSVIPRDSCREVEQAVRGLRNANDMHWLAAWGIVDNDQRTSDDIARLRENGVWPLAHYSVESLYYNQKVIQAVARRQAKLTGANADQLVGQALIKAIEAANANKAHLVTQTVLRAAREKVLGNLPKPENMERGGNIKINVDVDALRVAEEQRFDAFTKAADWEGLITRYPLRESSAFDRIVAGITLANRGTYQAAVLQLIQDDPHILDMLRGLLSGLYESINQ